MEVQLNDLNPQVVIIDESHYLKVTLLLIILSNSHNYNIHIINTIYTSSIPSLVHIALYIHSQLTIRLTAPHKCLLLTCFYSISIIFILEPARRSYQVPPSYHQKRQTCHPALRHPCSLSSYRIVYPTTRTFTRHLGQWKKFHHPILQDCRYLIFYQLTTMDTYIHIFIHFITKFLVTSNTRLILSHLQHPIHIKTHHKVHHNTTNPYNPFSHYHSFQEESTL